MINYLRNEKNSCTHAVVQFVFFTFAVNRRWYHLLSFFSRKVKGYYFFSGNLNLMI